MPPTFSHLLVAVALSGLAGTGLELGALHGQRRCHLFHFNYFCGACKHVRLSLSLNSSLWYVTSTHHAKPSQEIATLFLSLCFIHVLILSDSMNHLTWGDCKGDEKSNPQSPKSYRRNTCKSKRNPGAGPLGSQSQGGHQLRCFAVFHLEENRVHFHHHP